jgi:sec-independent protein translocase protein TatB
VFGFSFGEFVMICVVALVFVGPQKLPGLLHTLGQWIRKARTMLYDMRAQSGIDDILRAEGFQGGLGEMRSLLRGQHSALSALSSIGAPADSNAAPSSAAAALAPSPYADPNFSGIEVDPTKEYPPEGPDAYGALPDDLLDDGSELSADPVLPWQPPPPETAPAETAPAETAPAETAPAETAPATIPAEVPATPAQGNEAEAAPATTAAPSPPLTP